MQFVDKITVVTRGCISRMFRWRYRLFAYAMVTSVTLVVLALPSLWYIPTRNTLLSKVFPGAWMDIETMQLIKMHRLSQPIDVGRCPMECTKLHKPRARREDVEKRDVLFYDDFKLNYSNYAGDKWRFLPLLSRAEKIDLLYTLDVLMEVLQENKLQIFLMDGSLLGLARHRGIIPWDDDIDVGLNGSEWREVKNVLCCVEGFKLIPQNFMHWKFFPLSGSIIPMAPAYRFPFVDMFFYTEDKDYLWSLTHYNIQNFVAKKSDIFPLATGLFDGQSYPVPKKASMLAERQFRNIHICVSPGMIHRFNHALKGEEKAAIPCSSLRDLYKFYIPLPM